METQSPQQRAHVSSQLLDAALGLVDWEQVLQQISIAYNARGSNIIPIRAQSPWTIALTDNLVEFSEFYFRNEIHKVCIRQRAVPLMDRYGIAVDTDYTSETERETDPYYQEFLRPFGFLWSAYLGMKVEGDLLSCMIHRGVDQEPFDASEQQALLGLKDQMATAVKIARHMDLKRRQGLEEAFALADVPCILFAFNGTVVSVNETAAQLFSGVVQVRAGQIRTPMPEDGSRLQSAAHRLASDPTSETAGGIYLIRRPDRQPLVVRLLPMSEQLRDPFSAALVVALISDPSARPSAIETTVRTLYGLTATEARMLSLLADGRELADIAVNMGISYETARTHLRNIFSKTETHRQGELIALASRLR